MRSLVRLFVALVAGAVLLPGCAMLPLILPPASSSLPTSGEQTVKQACGALYDLEFNMALTRLEENTSDAVGPKGLAKEIRAFADVLRNHVPRLGDKEVKAQVKKTLAAVTKVGSLLDSAKGTSAWRTSLRKAITKMETEGNNLDALCLGS
ncbi:MAG: hypothetical protein KDB60_19110 [Propionibacteriaceae bacterium]|nr:hypothetical protein [Propionibacteriaceae bacterium]